MSPWPGFAWFIRPSGGPYPGASWVRLLVERPITAHPLGAWAVVGVMAIGGVHGFGAWWAVLLGEGVNQWHKATRGVYGRHLWREVVWRMLLSAVATLPAWIWL